MLNINVQWNQQSQPDIQSPRITVYTHILCNKENSKITIPHEFSQLIKRNGVVNKNKSKDLKQINRKTENQE